jgi:NAD(P)-dependent dehydrogenase (short-subunit alcohol dehydrogenase family)
MKIIITGSSEGIGFETAKILALQNNQITLVARNQEKLEKALSSLPGHGHSIIVADLGKKQDVDTLAERIATEHYDVLINNAGVFFDHPIESSSYEQWQQAWADTLGVNLIGAANVTWCALQHMPKHSTSRIVNIGSRGAFRGEPVSPAYGASKAAIVAFGQSIAVALAPMNIAVTTLAPGFVETDMAARLLDGPEGDGIRAQSPFNRVARPEELAKAVYFLASADNEWASGAVLYFNGASYLRM